MKNIPKYSILEIVASLYHMSSVDFSYFYIFVKEMYVLIWYSRIPSALTSDSLHCGINSFKKKLGIQEEDRNSYPGPFKLDCIKKIPSYNFLYHLLCELNKSVLFCI